MMRVMNGVRDKICLDNATVIRMEEQEELRELTFTVLQKALELFETVQGSSTTGDDLGRHDLSMDEREEQEEKAQHGHSLVLLLVVFFVNCELIEGSL
jgi:hypothetical protein